MATVTPGIAESSTCKAVLKYGKPIVICGFQPKGSIFLLHTLNSDQKTPDPLYQCIWKESKPGHCFGLDGFSYFNNESDAEHVAIEIPLASVNWHFFCKASDSRTLPNCSFDIGDISVLPTSTSTECNNTCSNSTAAPCPSDNRTHQIIISREIGILLASLFTILLTVAAIPGILLVKSRRQTCQRHHPPPNEGIGLMELNEITTSNGIK